jgi:hypothetical protein
MGIRRVLGCLCVITILTIAMLEGMPVAMAAFTGVTAPTQSVTPRGLAAPTAFSCSAVSLSVHMTWANADSGVTDPYSGGSAIDGYVVEHNINGAGWTVAATPGAGALAVNDNSFGSATLVAAPVTYRIHSIRSTFWASSVVSSAFTAHVTAAAGAVTVVTCS